MVLCLLGRKLMTSRPLLEVWLQRLLLVVLKTPVEIMRLVNYATLANNYLKKNIIQMMHVHIGFSREYIIL